MILGLFRGSWDFEVFGGFRGEFGLFWGSWGDLGLFEAILGGFRVVIGVVLGLLR